MEINKLNVYSKTNFKGHEAKPLEAIVVQNRRYGQDAIFKQLDAIASQYKVKVIKAPQKTSPWIQDDMIVTHDKRVTGYKSELEGLFAEYNLTYFNPPKKGRFPVGVEGGNLFFVTDKNGKNVIITARRLDEKSLVGLEKEFNVDRIIELQKADYHADLFITPIGDNKILVANDNLMLKNMEKMAKRISTFIDSNPDDKDVKNLREIRKKLKELTQEFRENKNTYAYNYADEIIASDLAKEGFEVIKVPSRIYECERQNDIPPLSLTKRKLNYSNAITFKTENNDTVFITGKSNLDEELGITEEISQKVGIGFERAFRNAIKPHIKPEHTYFITGSENYPISEILYNNAGGLHCMCSEIPKEK